MHYWAYLPDPPSVRPVIWANPTPRVHTNVPEYFGGITSEGIEHAEHYMNWSGISVQVPICLQASSHEQILMNGCMMVKQGLHIVSYLKE